mmetsp:Transcript_26097/g.81908  ORF Transcript_26097/g.81908 Transcript_26097/m.81908 type:complete len:281 (-) Transcript_26097:350-1192(-)
MAELAQRLGLLAAEPPAAFEGRDCVEGAPGRVRALARLRQPVAGLLRAGAAPVEPVWVPVCPVHGLDVFHLGRLEHVDRRRVVVQPPPGQDLRLDPLQLSSWLPAPVDEPPPLCRAIHALQVRGQDPLERQVPLHRLAHLFRHLIQSKVVLPARDHFAVWAFVREGRLLRGRPPGLSTESCHSAGRHGLPAVLPWGRPSRRRTPHRSLLLCPSGSRGTGLLRCCRRSGAAAAGASAPGSGSAASRPRLRPLARRTTRWCARRSAQQRSQLCWRVLWGMRM